MGEELGRDECMGAGVGETTEGSTGGGTDPS
jgi:hypothetical protein